MASYADNAQNGSVRVREPQLTLRLARWEHEVLPFREHARGVIQRLRAVEGREPEPKVLPQMIEALAARMN